MKESGKMDGKKEWFTLQEVAALLKPERDGYPLETAEAVEWLLNIFLSDITSQSGESVLLPSYVFNEPVEIWKVRDRKREDTELFTGLVDIWIEGTSPRQHHVPVPGFIDLTPELHRTQSRHGDYRVSLHYRCPDGIGEYPLIRLVESKAIRESEIVVSAETLSNYASEWGLDDVLRAIEQIGYSPEEVEQIKKARLSQCIARVLELRKTGLSDQSIVCRLYDTGEFKSWSVLGQAIDSDPNRALSPVGWHKKGIRAAGRENTQKKKKSSVKE
jgi:hypothetical protein